jgi:hypothetical protein
LETFLFLWKILIQEKDFSPSSSSLLIRNSCMQLVWPSQCCANFSQILSPGKRSLWTSLYTSYQHDYFLCKQSYSWSLFASLYSSFVFLVSNVLLKVKWFLP